MTSADIYDRVLTRADAPAALAEVRRLVTIQRFHARVLVQERDVIRQCRIEVDLPAGQWWMLTRREDGQHRSSEHRDGRTFRDGVPAGLQLAAHQGTPPALEPVFFDHLPWWGQHEHGFWPVLLRHIGTHSVLATFEHGMDPSMLSALVVDTRLGLVTRIMNFNAPYVILLDIELDRPVERLVPATWPELDVVHPDY
ncbi:hypothetical protein [Microbacterium sp.]|uniref:hypothetical protein n=1 Tax=Microbacterium sp. TaxID=51671 RepID=UPI003C743721